MHNPIEEFNIDKWSDEMMQIFEQRNKATYILVGTPRQEGKSLFWKRYQEAFKESQGKIEVGVSEVVFDEYDTLKFNKKGFK